jgi:hydrogenase maturation protease
MVRVLVVGYGNPLRGDDGLGHRVIAGLRERLAGPEYVAVHQLAPELAEALSNADLALFVDASAEGKPGEVHIEQLWPKAAEAEPLNHHQTPATLLALCSGLYGRSPQARLVTGVGANFEPGEELSPEGQHALEEICRLLPLLIRDFPAMW